MNAALIVAAVVILTVGWQAKYLSDRGAGHPAMWPLFLIAGLVPAWVAVQVLNPVPADGVRAQAKVSGQIRSAQLELPPGYALMVTATLADVDEKDPANQKTAYAMRLRGDGWEDGATGVMKRDSAGADDGITVVDGASVQEGGKKRAGRLGEDLQDRFEPVGSGTVAVEVTNWSGGAAETLDLEVVKAPPAKLLLWGLVVLVTLGGLFLEVRRGADQLAGNLAFLSLWAVFLRDGVTPLDSWQEVGKALLPAALFGWGGAGGLAYLLVKYGPASGDAPDGPAAEPAAPAAASAAPAAVSSPPASPPGGDGEGEGRRRRRRGA